jgi:hypothetical protein
VTGFVGEDAPMPCRRTFLAGLAAACATEPPMPADRVFELRNYLLRPGQRDVLIDLFEREFIESQEALGAHVVGTFRDLDSPDRFVWIRGFADFAARLAALDGFYSGPVWQAHRNAANATMIDADNVLLLRPLSGSLSRAPRTRPPLGAASSPGSLIVAATYFLEPGVEDAVAAAFARETSPRISEAGGELIATLATEPAANNYPRLPVREDVNALVAIARYRSVDAFAAWPSDDLLEAGLAGPVEIMRLQPTPRSLLR